MTTDAGLIPSATLKEAAMVSPLTTASRVPATAPISTRPIWPAPSMRPGVTHFPVASMRVASAGTARAGLPSVLALHGPRVTRERAARPHDPVRHLARLERPVLGLLEDRAGLQR